MCVVSGGENAVRTTLTGIFNGLVHRSKAEMRRLCLKQNVRHGAPFVKNSLLFILEV